MEKQIKIYHNPNCSKSRAVLERMESKGYQPEIVEYLHHTLTYDEVMDLLEKLDLSIKNLRTIVRADVPAYTEFERLEALGLDKQLLEHVLAHPELLNRPIVVTDKGARLCRPIELVDELL